MFTIGGLSGVMHSIVPADTQQTDTYFVVAHFHYVLFGGLIFAIFGGIYYWWPKIFGRMLNETLGKLQLLADAHRLQPHVLPDALPRPRGHAAPHLHATPTGMGWDALNLLATIGAFIIALSVLDLPRERRSSRPGAAESRGDDPWDAPHARVVDPVAAARVQLRRDPDRRRTATTSGTASTPRTTKAGS